MKPLRKEEDMLGKKGKDMGRFLLLGMALLLVPVLPVQAAEVHLSAAASLSDAVKKMVAEFQQGQPETVVLVNFGASGALAKQVAQGAPADLFISANPKWMEYLAGEGRVSRKTVRIFAGNRLVLVGLEQGAIASLADLQAMKRIALGSPKSVPAGQYAEQALRASGLYERLFAENKLVVAQDVHQALLYAERGEVDAAFVYQTDALLARRAVILYPVPETLHEAISYPMALTVSGEKNSAAAAFYEFLAGARAGEILAEYGFVVKGEGRVP
ncbi:molybdate ABC transporter substrate-binding protein [Thiovibrio sp. JS02]